MLVRAKVGPRSRISPSANRGGIARAESLGSASRAPRLSVFSEGDDPGYSDRRSQRHRVGDRARERLAVGYASTMSNYPSGAPDIAPKPETPELPELPEIPEIPPPPETPGRPEDPGAPEVPSAPPMPPEIPAPPAMKSPER